jgi:hypothetical protein
MEVRVAPERLRVEDDLPHLHALCRVHPYHPDPRDERLLGALPRADLCHRRQSRRVPHLPLACGGRLALLSDAASPRDGGAGKSRRFRALSQRPPFARAGGSGHRRPRSFGPSAGAARLAGVASRPLSAQSPRLARLDTLLHRERAARRSHPSPGLSRRRPADSSEGPDVERMEPWADRASTPPRFASVRDDLGGLKDGNGVGKRLCVAPPSAAGLDYLSTGGGAICKRSSPPGYI